MPLQQYIQMSMNNIIICLSAGPTCQGSPAPTQGLLDRFDDMSRPGPLWASVRGGSLSRGCGKIGTGNGLYFSGEGTREARTVPVDIRNIK